MWTHSAIRFVSLRIQFDMDQCISSPERNSNHRQTGEASVQKYLPRGSAIAVASSQLVPPVDGLLLELGFVQPGAGHVSVLVESIFRTVAAAEHVAVVEPAVAAAVAAGPDAAEPGAERDVVRPEPEPVLAPAVAAAAAAAAAAELVGSVGLVAVELVAVAAAAAAVELELGLGLDVVQLR